VLIHGMAVCVAVLAGGLSRAEHYKKFFNDTGVLLFKF